MSTKSEYESSLNNGSQQGASVHCNSTLAIPASIWTKCPSCGELVYVRQLYDNLKVCTCGYHMRLTAVEWLNLLDPGSFQEEDVELIPCDPLNFVLPNYSYREKLAENQKRTGLLDALISGRGAIDTYPLQFAVSEFEFMSASLGCVFGEKIARASERAAARRTPLLTITMSNGARIEEGIFSLMQRAKVAVALERLAAANQPHIALLIDPCYGSAIASYASMADIIIAEPGARIGFATKPVSDQGADSDVLAHFPTAEFMLAHGMIDMIVPRQMLRQTLVRLLRLYAQGVPAAPQLADQSLIVGVEHGQKDQVTSLAL